MVFGFFRSKSKEVPHTPLQDYASSHSIPKGPERSDTLRRARARNSLKLQDRKVAQLSLKESAKFLPEIPDVVSAPENVDKKVVAFYTNWSVYQRGYVPEMIDSSKCTHVVYSFADVLADGNVVESDKWADLEKVFTDDKGNVYQGCIAQLNKSVKSKNTSLKTLYAIGGWAYSKHFSEVAADPKKVETFVKSAIDVMQKHGFDGLMICWEYPVEGGNEDNSKSTSDRSNFAMLLNKIKMALDSLKSNHVLSVCIPAALDLVANIDCAAIKDLVDFAVVMSFDYKGASWSDETGHHSALYPNSQLKQEDSVSGSIAAYIQNGLQPSKIVPAVSMYGRGFGGVKADNNVMNKDFTQIPSGTFESTYVSQHATGIFDYWDIVDRFLQKDSKYHLEKYWDDVAKVPYLFGEIHYDDVHLDNKPTKTNLLIVYDDGQSVYEKSKLVNAWGLAGIACYDVAADCDGKKYGDHSLLKAACNALEKGDTSLPAGVTMPQYSGLGQQISTRNALPNMNSLSIQSRNTQNTRLPSQGNYPKLIVGYFISWGIYARNFTATSVPFDKLTHLNYAFANIIGGKIAIGDSWADIERPMYPGQSWSTSPNGNIGYINGAIKRQYPHLKTLISVGGWTWSGQFSIVARDATSRKIFADSCAEFVDKYGFDGVDLDWEYPGGNGLPGNATDPNDGPNYTLLCQACRDSLNTLSIRTGKKYLVTIASGANPEIIRRTENDKLGQVLDFMNVMTYDYRGGWSRGTGHQTPLYPSTRDRFDDGLGCSFVAIQDYIDTGFPPEKICIGVAFYGRGFQGVPEGGTNGLFQPYSSIPLGTWDAFGNEGATGVFDYKDLINRGLTEYWDDEVKAHWGYSPAGLMISYDSPRSITEKCWFVNANKLGGAMFWELSGDRGTTLLDPMVNILGSGQVADSPRPMLRIGNSPPTEEPPTEEPPTEEPPTEEPPTEQPPVQGNIKSGKMSVGYFISWGVYDRKYLASMIPAADLTHLNYAFANISGGKIALGDPWADVDNPMYPGQTPATYPNGNFGYINRDLKQKYPHLKTLISVGGWSWSGQFSVVARDMNSRKVFSDSCAEFIDKYGFDGVDIDWEFPGGDGLPGNVTDPSDGRNYTLLLQEIRNSLNALTARTRKSYLLTIASGANPRVIDRLEAGPVGFVLDFMNVMTYDYRGAWSRGTGHHTPLYPVVGDPFDDGFGSTFSAIQKYIENGFPHQKICLGAAFYGRGFQGVPNQNNGLFQTFTSIPQGTWENGVFDYKDLITRSGYTDHWDNNAKAPWRYSERTEIFISYDNVRSITEKSWFVNANKLGGVMFWELSGDRNNELLSTISGVLDSGEISPDSRPKLSLPTDPEDPADIIVQPPPTGIMLSAYFTYWSASNGYSPADIPMSQLTHLFYAYARINADGSLSAGDDFTDLVRPYDGTTGAYLYLNKVLKPNYPDLKILLSIGGYSGSQHFPSAFRNVSNFTASCLDFIDRYGFDGVDICWEWPGLQGSTSGNLANDMRLYAEAVNALRKAFNERNSGLLISVSAPSKKALVDALNYSTIVKPANFVNVKTFDYVSGASTKTGYLAPMYPSNFSEGSVKETIDTYVGREIPKKKVVLGVPFYGRSWINVPKGDNKGLGQTVTEQNLPPAADVPGGHLQELGLYPYHHIKKLLNQKKLGKNFDKTTVAEWAFCSTDGHFITFDSRCSLDAKASYVTTQDLGGIFAWEISGDSKDLDLIYGLNASLISGSCDYEGCGGGSSSPPPTPTPTPDPPGDSKFSKPIMGYYNALTGQAPINYTIDKVPADKISHLVYGPVTVSNGRVAWANVSRDAANMNIVNTQLKTKNRSLAVVVALGDNNFVNFMRTANAASLRTLAVSAKEFVETNGLQGLLVEYRWPTNATEGQNLTTLCRELRTAMSSLSPAPVLGCHIPWVSAFSTMPTPSVFMNAKEISDNVDFVSVQSYDFVAPGSPSSTYRMTGHNSNIEINMSSDPLRFASIAVTYKAYSDQGVPANKMVIGIPLFGRAFDGVPVAWQNGLFLVYSILPDGDPGYGTNVVTQTTINNMITTRNFKTFFDDKAGASYCFGPSTSMPNFGYFITHEDTRSVTAKCDLIKSLNLFGSALWDLSADDSEGTITGAVASHFSTA